jgi:hypothetical protein
MRARDLVRRTAYLALGELRMACLQRGWVLGPVLVTVHAMTWRQRTPASHMR